MRLPEKEQGLGAEGAWPRDGESPQSPGLMGVISPRCDVHKSSVIPGLPLQGWQTKGH